MTDHFTNASAVAATCSPWWLPRLADVSTDAAMILPILGVTWLLVQIGTRIYSTFK